MTGQLFFSQPNKSIASLTTETHSIIALTACANCDVTTLMLAVMIVVASASRTFQKTHIIFVFTPMMFLGSALLASRQAWSRGTFFLCFPNIFVSRGTFFLCFLNNFLIQQLLFCKFQCFGATRLLAFGTFPFAVSTRHQICFRT